MIQRRCRHGLVLETGDVFRIRSQSRLQGLQRHRAPQRSLPCLVRAHPALPKALDDFKFTKTLAYGTHSSRRLRSTSREGRGQNKANSPSFGQAKNPTTEQNCTGFESLLMLHRKLRKAE